MKIQAIFTGGTIGSSKGRDGRISPEQKMRYRLLEWYRQFGEQVEFQAEEPYYILSENIKADNLNVLLECVRSHLLKGDADGILVMHGTDTLQYTAAVLGYVFGWADIPVVLVSSDFPLEDERANGYTNFRYAVEFIKGGYGKGVFVSYSNPGEFPKIHRGTRLLAHQEYSAEIGSVRGTYYGSFRQKEYFPNPGYRVGENIPSLFGREDRVKLSADAREILRIVPYVGMVYPELTGEIKAVLHESFHSGTIAAGRGLERFASEADRLGIPIYLTGLCAGEAEYETVGRCRELGIQILPESAAISQYCKLWLLISNQLTLSEYMNRSVAEDLVYDAVDSDAAICGIRRKN